MIPNSVFLWWFFPSMSLYEWDHDAKIHIKNSHESLVHSLHPFTQIFRGVLSVQTPLIFSRKKVAHKHSWLFRSFFNLQWVNIRLLSLLRIRDLREWHDNFTTKKAFFAISQIVSFIRKKVCIANFLGKAKSVDKGKYYSKCLISSKTQNLSVKAFYE